MEKHSSKGRSPLGKEKIIGGLLGSGPILAASVSAAGFVVKSKPLRGKLNRTYNYVSNKNAWIVESLFGVEISSEFLFDAIVEDMFKNAKFHFYQNDSDTHLFSENSEILEYNFGKLRQISAFDALKKYGLEVLEEAKEKLYTKLK